MLKQRDVIEKVLLLNSLLRDSLVGQVDVPEEPLCTHPIGCSIDTHDSHAKFDL